MSDDNIGASLSDNDIGASLSDTLTLLDLPPELILEEIGKWIGTREGVVRLAACCKCLREIFLGSKYARKKFDALPWILTYSTGFDQYHLPTTDLGDFFPYVLDVSHLTWPEAEELESLMINVGAAEINEDARRHVCSFPAVHSGKSRQVIGSILKGIGFHQVLETRREMAEDLLTHGSAWKTSRGEFVRPRDLEANPFSEEEKKYIRAWGDLSLDLWKKYYASKQTIRIMRRAIEEESHDADMAQRALFHIGRIDTALTPKPGSGALSAGCLAGYAMFQFPDNRNPLNGKKLVMY